MKKKNNTSWFYLALAGIVVVALYGCSGGDKRWSGGQSADSLTSTSRIVLDPESVHLPEIQAYLSEINAALKKQIPVLGLQRALTPSEEAAQAIALRDPNFTSYTRDSTGKACRNEIFGIYPARASDVLVNNRSIFDKGQCYRVEMYNFASNITTVAVVTLLDSLAFQVTHYVAMQPELPDHLRELAIRIATASERVQTYLGVDAKASNALMADTKTSLNQSRCERSRHLCVAPTFVQGTKALWTIVDLTDLRLAGLRWTNLGETPVITDGISERQVQNEAISTCYCQTENVLARNGWEFSFMITGNDGLRISGVKFNGKPVIDNAKLVDWHVSYSKTDGFGYSDAVGCPFFSSATVVAVEEPIEATISSEGKEIGFSLEQYFRTDNWPSPCNYEYFQRYEFYNDGSFRIAAANIGRGCGNDGTYRPVFRIALAGQQNRIEEWKEGTFSLISQEGWRLQESGTTYDPKGAMFRVRSGDRHLRLIPGNGQFNDGGRGDNAYVYFTLNKPDEGEGDLPTIGPCCNNDHRQGPEKFIEENAESITDARVVVWYVPQMKNDDTPGRSYCWAEAKLVDGVYRTTPYPCIAGPLFIPE